MAKVIYEIRDRVAYVTINRPEKKNAIDAEVTESLWRAFQDIKENPDVWIGVLTGVGDTFSTGHDLSWHGAPTPGSGKASSDLYEYIHTIWKPVVSAINGYCIAQGAGLALSCDIRIAADTVQFGWPQVKRGIMSVSGPTVLCRLVPYNIALQYLLTGDYFPVQEALRWGMVNMVVPRDKLMEVTEDLVRNKLLANAPLPMRAIKEVGIRGMHMDIADQNRLAGLFAGPIEASEDSKEGIAAFFEKRAPQFKGR